MPRVLIPQDKLSRVLEKGIPTEWHVGSAQPEVPEGLRLVLVTQPIAGPGLDDVTIPDFFNWCMPKGEGEREELHAQLYLVPESELA